MLLIVWIILFFTAFFFSFAVYFLGYVVGESKIGFVNTLTHRLFRKDTAIALFLKDNKQLSFKTIFINKKAFSFKGGRYQFNKDNVFFKKNMPFIFYYEGNPVSFKTKNSDLVLDSQSYKKLLESDILKTILGDKTEKIIIMVLLFVIIGVVGYIVLYLNGVVAPDPVKNFLDGLCEVSIRTK